MKYYTQYDRLKAKRNTDPTDKYWAIGLWVLGIVLVGQMLAGIIYQLFYK